MSAQVEGGESDSVDGQLFGGGMQGGHVLRHPVVLEHVEQGRLARVVQPQEEELAGLLPQPQVSQHPREPVPHKHLERWLILKENTD